jgi:hypothetical protein
MGDKPTSIELSFDSKAREVADGCRLAYSRVKFKEFFYGGFYMFCGALPIRSEFIFWRVWGGYFIVLGFLVATGLWGQFRIARSLRRTGRSCHYTFDDRGIKLAQQSTELSWRWDAVQSWREDREVITLRLPAKMVLVIPKRAFTNEGAIAELKQIVTYRLKHRDAGEGWPAGASKQGEVSAAS